MNPYRLALGNLDLLHSLGAWLPTRSVRFKTVVTIQDIHTIDQPELVHESRARRRAAKLRRSGAAADAVITPSEFTRGRVIDRLGIDPERVFAIHHGIDTERFRGVDSVSRAPFESERPFILGSGQAPSRKRGDLLIEAWGRSDASQEFDLVLFGGEGEACPILMPSRTRVRHPDRVHLLGYVDDALLLALYQHARCCVFPNEYEGFGLPLLEAMAIGCPIAASDIAAFREVTAEPTGDLGAAVLFEPGRVARCSEAIDQLCRHEELCRILVANGEKRVRAFSWAEAARATVDAYQAVLGW